MIYGDQRKTFMRSYMMMEEAEPLVDQGFHPRILSQDRYQTELTDEDKLWLKNANRTIISGDTLTRSNLNIGVKTKRSQSLKKGGAKKRYIKEGEILHYQLPMRTEQTQRKRQRSSSRADEKMQV